MSLLTLHSRSRTARHAPWRWQLAPACAPRTRCGACRIQWPGGSAPGAAASEEPLPLSPSLHPRLPHARLTLTACPCRTASGARSAKLANNQAAPSAARRASGMRVRAVSVSSSCPGAEDSRRRCLPAQWSSRRLPQRALRLRRLRPPASSSRWWCVPEPHSRPVTRARLTCLRQCRASPLALCSCVSRRPCRATPSNAGARLAIWFEGKTRREARVRANGTLYADFMSTPFPMMS